MNTPFTTESGRYHATLIVEDLTELTLSDLSRACRAQTTTIIELVEEGVITPQGGESAQAQWRFTGAHLHRARVAVTLQRDLGVNWAGAALALELLEAMDELKSQLRRQT